MLKSLDKIRYITIKRVKYDLYKQIHINTNELSREFSLHAERAAFWGQLYANELRILNKREDELQEMVNVRFKMYWELYEARGRTFSDSLIRSEVYGDEKVINKRKEVRIAKAKVEALKAVCSAFEHRKSSLINLGALKRREELMLYSKKEV